MAWHFPDERVPWIRELTEIVGRMESVANWPRAKGSTVPAPEGLQALANTWSYVYLARDR